MDEEDDGDDNTSFNGGYGKPSMSPYDDDDIGKSFIFKGIRYGYALKFHKHHKIFIKN